MAQPNSLPPRAVIDTNIIIRAVLSPKGGSALIRQSIYQRRCILVTSREHLNEVFRVLGRTRMQQRYDITLHERKRVISRLFPRAIVISLTSFLNICRDPKDNYLIALALAGQATHLVSEDLDLHNDPTVVSFLLEFGVRLVDVKTFLLELSRVSSSPH